MPRKIPILELRNPANWSRIHPLVVLFFIVLIILIIGIASSSLHFLILPATIVIALYVIFLWKTAESLV